MNKRRKCNNLVSLKGGRFLRRQQNNAKLQQEAVGGNPQPLFYAKREKYVDYRKKFKYSVSNGSILALHMLKNGIFTLLFLMKQRALKVYIVHIATR